MDIFKVRQDSKCEARIQLLAFEENKNDLSYSISQALQFIRYLHFLMVHVTRQIAYLVVTEACYTTGCALFYRESDAQNYIDTECVRLDLDSFVHQLHLPEVKSDFTYHLVVSEEFYGGIDSVYMENEQILLTTEEEANDLIDRKVNETAERIDFITHQIIIR